MKRYINIRVGSITETVDELCSSDFKSTKEFNTKLALLRESYRMVIRQGVVYSSQRCAGNW